MKVFNFDSYKIQKNTGLIIGAFESFHNGHSKMLDACIESKLNPTVMMFRNPDELPKNKLPLFQTLNARLIRLAELGIKNVILLDTKQILPLQPEDFVKLLVDKIQPVKIYVGRDFKFGKNSLGDSEKMKLLFASTEITKEYKMFAKKVSTTFMKELLELGDLKTLSRMYGTNYMNTYSINNGVIIEEGCMTPHSGIYIAEFEIKSIKYWGLVRVAANKEMTVHIPDLETDEEYLVDDVLVHWIDKLRLTISEKNDNITNDDYKSAIKILNSEIIT